MEFSTQKYWGYKLLIERALGASNYRTERTVSRFPFRSFDAIVPLFPFPGPFISFVVYGKWPATFGERLSRNMN